MGHVVQILEGVMDVNVPPIPRSLKLFVESQEHIIFFTVSPQARVHKTKSDGSQASSHSKLLARAHKQLRYWYLSYNGSKFFHFLKIVGVGFKARAEAEGRLLYLKLGYSHEVELTVPPAVRVFCFKNNVVCCTRIDKERVHQFAASIRSCKPLKFTKAKA
ncbi:Ribosomal protein L6 domain-containing protein [Forsythia ovata]|uniref:Ribosomal protein L6 domain-containing protein n=1 Tax=Forsythia ovata TaxID=205694 RepID=A0ABD1U6E1_9LAMI